MSGSGNNTLSVTGGNNQFVVVYKFASPGGASGGNPGGGSAPAFGAAGSLNNTNPAYDFTSLDNGKVYTIDGGENELVIEGGNKQFVVEYLLPANDASAVGGNTVTVGGGNNKFVVAYDFSAFEGSAGGGNTVTVDGGNNAFVVSYDFGEANEGAGGVSLSGPGSFGQGGTGNNSSVIAGTSGDNKVDIKGENNQFVVEYGNSMSGGMGGGNPFAGGAAAGGMGGNPFAGAMGGGNPFAGGGASGGMGGGNPFAGGMGGGAAGGGNPFAGGGAPGGAGGGNPFAGGGASGGAPAGGADSPFGNSPLAGLLQIPGVEDAGEAINVFANGADPAEPSSGAGSFGSGSFGGEFGAPAAEDAGEDAPGETDPAYVYEFGENAPEASSGNPFAGGGNPFAGGAGGGNPFAGGGAAGGMGGGNPFAGGGAAGGAGGGNPFAGGGAGDGGANPAYVYNFGGNAPQAAGSGGAGGNPFAGGGAAGGMGGGNPFAGGGAAGGMGGGNPFAGGGAPGGAGGGAGAPSAGGPGMGGGAPSSEELQALLGQSPFGRIGDAVGYDKLAQGFFSALGNQPANPAAENVFGNAAPGSNPFSGLGTNNNPATARGFGGDGAQMMGQSMFGQQPGADAGASGGAWDGSDSSFAGGQLLAGAPMPTGSGLIGGDAMEVPPLFAA